MRLLIFGPNGSGKGTQSARLVKKHQLAHVESGGIFRTNIKGGTKLGIEAKKYIDRGALVPDAITIPMIIDRLAQDDCQEGWILDGFPRNPDQAMALVKGLEEAGTRLDAVLVIDLDRAIAKARLMGRRTCPQGHPNNTAIPAIAPKQNGDQLCCWKCQTPVTVRKDDVDEEAIDVRLDIYFDEREGTQAAVTAMSRWARENSVPMITVKGEGTIEEISQTINRKLA